MQTLARYSAGTIFTKTAKGYDEIAQRMFGLTSRQRRVLIIIDGIRSLAAMAEMMPREDLNEVISFLHEEGFIQAAKPELPKPVQTNFQHTRSHPAEELSRRRESHGPATSALQAAGQSLLGKPALSQDPAQIRQIKDFMTTTATTYLGLLAADVIHRIERAKSAEQLMTVVGQWHMALRESKQGNRFASPYMEQVTAALMGKASGNELDRI